MSDLVAKIPQKLQEQSRFLMFPTDDVLAFAIPTVLGLAVIRPVLGIALGLGAYKIWTMVKGKRGIVGLMAWLYWWIPKSFSPFKSFPASHVETFEG